MLAGRQHQVGHVGNVVGQKHHPFPARNLASGQEHRQTGQCNGAHHPQIEVHHGGGHVDAGVASGRAHHAGNAQPTQNVEGVAAHHIAHGNVALALDCRHDRGGDFGHGGASCHNGQANHQITHPKGFRKHHRRLNQPVGAQHQQPQAHGNQQPLRRHVVQPGGCLGRRKLSRIFVPRRLTLASRLPHQEHRVGHHQAEQNHAV